MIGLFLFLDFLVYVKYFLIISAFMIHCIIFLVNTRIARLVSVSEIACIPGFTVC